VNTLGSHKGVNNFLFTHSR